MLVVGLTGGIGSGKSTVAELFARLGVTIIDADVIAHALVQTGMTAFAEIVAHFGERVIDRQGNLDRRSLRAIIFQDPVQRAWLEQLLHPLIMAEMTKQIAESSSVYCLAVVPLLVEKDRARTLINRILVVDASEQLQLARTQLRDNSDPSAVAAIIKTQASQSQRLAMADDIIHNDKDLADLTQQVQQLHDYYLSLAAIKAVG